MYSTTATPLSPTTAILQVSKAAAATTAAAALDHSSRRAQRSAQTDDSGIGSTDLSITCDEASSTQFFDQAVSQQKLPASNGDDRALICTETIDSVDFAAKNVNSASARQSPPDSPPVADAQNGASSSELRKLLIDDAVRTVSTATSTTTSSSVQLSNPSNNTPKWTVQPEIASMLTYRLQQEQNFHRKFSSETSAEQQQKLWPKLFTLQIRQKLINWMSEITEVYQCLPCILPIGVGILDRIMTADADFHANLHKTASASTTAAVAPPAVLDDTAAIHNNFAAHYAVLYNIEKLQLVGACCVMLATKLLSQSHYLDTSDLRKVLPDYVEWQHVVEVEQAIMRRLGFTFSATVELNTIAFVDLLIENIAKSTCGQQQQLAAAAASELGTVSADERQQTDARLSYLFTQYTSVIRQLAVEIVHTQLTNYELCSDSRSSQIAAACLVRGLAGALQHAYDNAFCTASSANNDVDEFVVSLATTDNDNNGGGVDNDDFFMLDDNNNNGDNNVIPDDFDDRDNSANPTFETNENGDEDDAWMFLRDLGYNEAMNNHCSAQLLVALVAKLCALMHCDQSDIFEALLAVCNGELTCCTAAAAQHTPSLLAAENKSTTSKRTRQVVSLITSCMELSLHDDHNNVQL